MEKNEVTEMYDAASIRSDKESIAVDLLAERPEQGSNFLAYANVVCVVAGKQKGENATWTQLHAGLLLK
jgi:hypothetical protein